MALSTDWFLTRLLDLIQYANVYILLSFALGLFVLVRPLFVDSVVSVDAPTVGKRSKYEPLFWVRTRFFGEAWPILRDGYKQFSKSRFRFVRSDADIIVISNKYVDEIRSLPTNVLSPIQAHVDNLLGKYSTTDILLESDLHTRMLQTKLTPNLGTFIPAMKEELQLAIADTFPDCKGMSQISWLPKIHLIKSEEAGEWTPVQIHPIFLKLVARVSARIFVGIPLCRDAEWLDTSIHYTENVFRTVTAMRLFPRPIQPFISLFTPHAWRVPRNLRLAQQLIVPLIVERKRLQAAGDPSYRKPNDLLQWMMDAANEDEGQPRKLAHRQLLLTLAAIHTSTMAATHVMFDLCAQPEYIEPLREEVEAAIREDGGWRKATLNKMQKLDSFLKESQRFTPPSLLAFNRVALEPVTLSDGFHLPRGTRFSMSCAEILHDPNVTPNPEKFDGFRYYKERQKPGENTRHQFATTDVNNLHFGHGKYSCPGRFFAANEIKMILAHMLLLYDFRFSPGQSRPKNMTAHEYIFPDPEGLIMCKERENLPERMFATI
ncbi:MAG: hypothetical protein Q9207_007070 [Kuettlingeria erythrocarpa]